MLSIFYFRRTKPIAFRELRINEQIRIPNLRLFDDITKEAFGIVALEKARELANERDLDLVEVAPTAQPPVCRLMDYGRYKFEALKKEKESRRDHSVIKVKEIKLRPKISEHDFQTKFGYVKHFLQRGAKVKLTIMFRGREMVHQEYGRRLLDRMAADLQEAAAVERSPLLEGRNMIMILSPLSKKHKTEAVAATKPTPVISTLSKTELAPSENGEAKSVGVESKSVDADSKPVSTVKAPTAKKQPSTTAAKTAAKKSTTAKASTKKVGTTTKAPKAPTKKVGTEAGKGTTKDA